MPRPRQAGTSYAASRNYDAPLFKTSQASPEFECDAQSVNDQLEQFEYKHRLATAEYMEPGEQRKKYKYPNIELKRCFDPKKFRESNAQIQRALVMSTQRDTTTRASKSHHPSSRGTYFAT